MVQRHGGTPKDQKDTKSLQRMVDPIFSNLLEVTGGLCSPPRTSKESGALASGAGHPGQGAAAGGGHGALGRPEPCPSGGLSRRLKDSRAPEKRYIHFATI